MIEEQSQKGEHILPYHMTVIEFAKHKKCGRQTIYDAIASGTIIPVKVGYGKSLFIDCDKYVDLKFRSYKERTTSK